MVTINASNAYITGFAVQNATTGVLVSSGTSNELHFNNIVNNTDYGVNGTLADEEVNAINNWWGAASGPTRADNPGGTGDAVGDNVNFDPWLGAEIEETESETVSGSGTVEDTSTGGNVTIDAPGNHTITTVKYADNPGGEPTFQATGNYWDVHLDNATNVASITIEFCPAGPFDTIYYWDATSNSWKPCSDQVYADGCITVTITDDTEPSLEDLTGQEFGRGRQGAPEQVPVLTPIGIIALIGILSVVLAVATSKRRR